MSSAHLDRVAEALYLADTSMGGRKFGWWEIARDHRMRYRAMAQAAIAAMELSRDIGYTIKDGEPEDGGPHAWFNEGDIRDDEIAELLNDGRKLWHRLVSPWRADGEG